MTGTPGKHGLLAPFAEDWVGGDIGGLRALATALYGFVPQITGMHAALDQRPTRLTDGDDDWAQALAAVIGQAAGIIGGLAAELAAIENALEEQAHAVSRYDVNIGTDGRPPPVSTGPAVDATTASKRHWVLVYRQRYDQAMTAAQQARKQATRQLRELYPAVEPPRQVLATSDSAVGQP
jgi:hypothetical protein